MWLLKILNKFGYQRHFSLAGGDSRSSISINYMWFFKKLNKFRCQRHFFMVGAGLKELHLMLGTDGEAGMNLQALFLCGLPYIDAPALTSKDLHSSAAWGH